jgi:hypothetical protein
MKTVQLVPLDARKMFVEMAEGFVAELCVVSGLPAHAAYVGSAVAEAIKATHAPTHREQTLQHIWVPHTPRHNHDLERDLPNCPTRAGHFNKLMLAPMNHESILRAKSYHEKKERERAEEAEAARAIPSTEEAEDALHDLFSSCSLEEAQAHSEGF